MRYYLLERAPGMKLGTVSRWTLDWAIMSVCWTDPHRELSFRFIWTDDIADASSPWVCFPKCLLPRSWNTGLSVDSSEVMAYCLGQLDNTILLGLPQSCATSPFRPLLVTRLIMRKPRAQLSGVYCCISELFMCHSTIEGWIISQSTHPIRKAPLLTLAAAHVTQTALVHQSCFVHFTLTKGHAILFSLKMLRRVN